VPERRRPAARKRATARGGRHVRRCRHAQVGPLRACTPAARACTVARVAVKAAAETAAWEANGAARPAKWDANETDSPHASAAALTTCSELQGFPMAWSWAGECRCTNSNRQRFLEPNTGCIAARVLGPQRRRRSVVCLW
jgi:hypothetical protein